MIGFKQRSVPAISGLIFGLSLSACASPELAQAPATQPTELVELAPDSPDAAKDELHNDDPVREAPGALPLRDVAESRDPFAPVRERTAETEPASPAPTASAPQSGTAPPTAPGGRPSGSESQPVDCTATAEGCTDQVRLLDLGPPVARLQVDTSLYEVEVGDTFGPGLMLVEMSDDCVVVADDRGNATLCVDSGDAGLK